MSNKQIIFGRYTVWIKHVQGCRWRHGEYCKSETEHVIRNVEYQKSHHITLIGLEHFKVQTILTWVLQKQSVRMGTGLIRLWMGCSRRVL
jgi:hypothetical protein